MPLETNSGLQPQAAAEMRPRRFPRPHQLTKRRGHPARKPLRGVITPPLLAAAGIPCARRFRRPCSRCAQLRHHPRARRAGSACWAATWVVVLEPAELARLSPSLPISFPLSIIMPAPPAGGPHTLPAHTLTSVIIMIIAPAAAGGEPARTAGAPPTAGPPAGGAGGAGRAAAPPGRPTTSFLVCSVHRWPPPSSAKRGGIWHAGRSKIQRYGM